MKLADRIRKPHPDDPLAELARLRSEQRRAVSQLAAAASRREELVGREVELAEADIAAFTGDCDAAEHDRQRRQLEVDKVAAAAEHERLDRIVGGLQDRCLAAIAGIARERIDRVYARRRAVEGEIEELHARIAALATGLASLDVEREEIEHWRTRESRDGGLGRPDPARPTFTPEERELLRAAPDFVKTVHLPGGQPAYGRFPSAVGMVNPVDPLR